MSEEPDIPRISPARPRHRMRGSLTWPVAGARRADRPFHLPFETPPRRVGLVAALISSLTVAGIAAAVLPSQLRATSAKPTAGPTGPRAVEATVGSVQRTLVLNGLVVRQPDEELRAPATGTVTSVAVDRGEVVTAGTNLVVVTVPTPVLPSPSPSPTPTISPSPSPTSSPTVSPSPVFTFSPPPVAPVVRQIAAPIDGVVKEVRVVLGQNIRSGRVVLVLAPGQFDVIAPISSDLLYQFLAPPLEITATIDQGPAPFVCAFTSIGDNLDVIGAETILEEDADLRCSVPADVDVFPGVRVRLETTTADAVDVVLLPRRVIEIHRDEGDVWVVEKGHAPVRRTVHLGISDGKMVEITAGLRAGERVLERPPG